MSILKQHNSMLNSVKVYEKLLETLSEEEFKNTPEAGIWSYAEVYSHIFQSNLGSLIAVEKCILGTGNKSDKTIHWIAWLVLFIGRFPPGKIKAPERIASMVSKINMEEARNLIIKFKKRLEDLTPRINKASKDQTIKHPRLGLLNASQWFRFIEVHTRHHARQLHRINKALKDKGVIFSEIVS